MILNSKIDKILIGGEKMNIKELPWWLCAGLIVFLLIWKTPWMKVVEWLIMIGMGTAIVVGVVIVGFVLISIIILPWTSRSKMCDPRISLKEWQKIKTQKGGGKRKC